MPEVLEGERQTIVDYLAHCATINVVQQDLTQLQNVRTQLITLGNKFVEARHANAHDPNPLLKTLQRNTSKILSIRQRLAETEEKMRILEQRLSILDGIKHGYLDDMVQIKELDVPTLQAAHVAVTLWNTFHWRGTARIPRASFEADDDPIRAVLLHNRVHFAPIS